MRAILSALLFGASISLSFAQSVPQQILYPELTGNALLTQIRTDYKPATVYSYNTARDSMFSRTYNVNGVVTCVYTGDTIDIPYGIASPRPIANNHVPNWSTEHVFPQSMGALTGNANSDMHHLMPVRQDVNGSRSNTPFGYVSAAQASIWWGSAGSQTATPSGDLNLWSRAQGSSKFEPRTESKGNIARAAFYFFTMYTDVANSGFFHGMMSDLRGFHAQDVVDPAEYERTNHIGRMQGNKPNPFIIDTTLVRRIFFTDYTPPVPSEGSPDTYVADMEDATKGAYALGSVLINGQNWSLSNVLIGSLTADRKTGSKAMRVMYSQAVNIYSEMLTNREQGMGTVSFDYARYDGTDDRLATAPTFVLEVNSGGTWYAVGEPISLDGVDVLTTKTISVQEPGPSRIRFRAISGSSGRRFNIDNITITPYVEETAELAIPISNTEGWRMIASPISTTYSALLANVWTQGAIGSDAPSATPSVFTYSPADGLLPVTDLNATLSAGQGLIFAHFNDDDYDGLPNSSPTSLTVEGPLPAGVFTLTAPVSDTWGFVLAGNPTASPISFANVVRSGGAQDKIWVWDPAQGRYLNRSSGVGDFDGKISPFQGFWLQYDQNGSFRFDRGSVTSSATFLGKESEPYVAEITICEQHITECELFPVDKAFLSFRDGAILGLDTYDSPKFASLDEEAMLVSTLIGDSPYHIQFLPATLTERVEVPVNIRAKSSQNVNIRVNPIHLPSGMEITIREENWQSSQIVNLEQRRYTLVVDPATTSTKDDERGTWDEFALSQNYPNPFNPNTVIGFTIPNSRVRAIHELPLKIRLTVFDMLGREVAVLVDGPMSAGSHFVNFDASELPSGVYVYVLDIGGRREAKKMLLIK